MVHSILYINSLPHPPSPPNIFIYLLGGPHFRGLRHLPPQVGMGSRQDCLGVGLRSASSLAPQGQVVMASGRSVHVWQGPWWQVSSQWWFPHPNVLLWYYINKHLVGDSQIFPPFVQILGTLIPNRYIFFFAIFYFLKFELIMKSNYENINV